MLFEIATSATTVRIPKISDVLKTLASQGGYLDVDQALALASDQYGGSSNPEAVTILLARFGATVQIGMPFCEILSAGFVPANAAQLLMLGIENPTIKNACPIIALGNIFTDAAGRPFVISLNRLRSRLSIERCDLQGFWEDRCSFAVLAPS